MKKWQQTGKKALSVFMAIMMLMTAWVWVAPTEASAAAGTYDVKINWYVTDEMDSNGGTITLKTKGNNGTDSSATTHSAKSWVNSDSVTNNTWSQDFIWTGVGFPYSYNFTLSDTFWPREMNATVHVYVRKSGSSDAYTEVGTHSFADWGDNTTHNDNVFTIASGKTPVATTFTWSNTPETMYCPKTGSATQTVAVTAVDQYGVQMYDPTWSVKGSSCGTSGISVTSTTTKSSSTTITLTNSGNNTSTTDTQTGTVTATWGSATSSKTFTIYDSYYTDTFNYKDADGNDTSATRSAYHGDTITPPSPPQYYDGDYLKTFSAWSPAIATTITKDVTYNATYTQQFIEADYTAVNEAIAAANAIKANYGTEYELKYTHASRLALDSAINAVVTGLGRTKQDVVDGYANAINEALNLEVNKFDVIFLDKDGAILLYEKDVEYKEAVTAPTYSATYYDSTNHYTFTGWDTDEYASVVDDLVIQPVFTAEAHTFTTETVPSTCVQKGATKYICSCGYSYIDGETNYGDHVWETEFTTDLEPTCTVAGSKSIHCTLCDAQKDITVIDPLGHQWSSQSVAVEASCGKIGIMTKVCDDCGVCEHTIIPALEHDYAENIVAPTCTTKGYTEYVCQRADCGHSYRDNYTDVTAHNYGAWETVSEAHCEVAGVKKRVCVDCGFTELGSIDALEHNLNDWVVVVTETCTGKGYQIKTCSLCENVIEEKWIDALGHNYVEKTVVAPTCTSKGYTVEECNRADCGAQRVVDEKEALNHAWTSTTHAADCTHSAYIEHVCANDPAHNYIEYVSGSAALMHDFTGTETEVTPATCTTDGEKTVKCSRCDATTTVIVPHLGHTWGKWTVTKEATNTIPGEMTRTCSNDTCSETVEIPAGGHEFDNGTVTKVATCVEAGTMLYKCTAHENCGITLEVTIPVTQHTVAQKVVEATCTVPGSVEAYCSACNKSFNIKPTPIKAHNPVKGETVAPTCTTSGYTVYACDCGTFSYNEYDASKPATGHPAWTKTDEKAATCTEDGYIKYECSVCKAPKEEILPKTGHSFTENTAKATAATCTSLATKTYECACGASYVEYYGELAAHNYNTLVKTVPATNDSLGYEEYKCDCGLTKITILEATGTHVFNERIADECVAPTCTENGIEVYKCSAHDNCGVKSSVLVPRLGHTVEAVYNAPTCKAEGSSAAYCTTCDTVVDSVAIPATGIHDWNEGVETTAPTCEEEGEKTYTCSVCSETKTAAIPAKGHDLSTTVVDATCEANGTVEITCSRCDDTDVEKTIYLTKKNHDWNEGKETTAPTCEEEGVKTYTCLVCGDTRTESIPAKGHTWGDWVVTPSTNSAKGSVSRSCLICGAKETVDIPAGNHKLVVDTEKSTSASCNAKGTTVFKCENHDNCGITLEFTTEMTQHSLVTETNAATCTEKGEVITRCEKCNNVSIVTEIPAKGHAFVTSVEEATCEKDGKVVTECNVCHSEDVRDEKVLAKLGHDYTGEETVEKSPTCTENGLKKVKCSRCDKTNDVIIPRLGHNYGDWKVEKEATNTESGKWTRECENCKDVEEVIIPAGGHNSWDNGTETKPATCSEEGTMVYKCTSHDDCGVTIEVSIPVKPHTVEQKVVKATCTANGSVKAHCTVCDANCEKPFSTVDIPATGHSYVGTETTPATCTGEGVMTYTCSNCDASYIENIPMIQHVYEKGETKAATCLESGYVTFKCKCGSSYIEITENAKGHTLTKGESTANCTEDGELELKCACGYTEKVAVPALGHRYTQTGNTDATCTAAATLTYSCTCGESYTVSTGEKTAHDFGEYKVIAEATEDALGYKTRSCKVCGFIELEEIAAIGDHEFTTLQSETLATCTNPGEKVYGCSTHDDCGLTSTIVIPANGHVEYIASSSDADCETDGEIITKCKNCDEYEKKEVIPALGHKYGEGAVTPATCTDKGHIVYTCGTCNGTYESVIDINENAHQYETSYKNATCTEAGYVITKCKLCKDETVNEVIPVLEHSWKKIGETKADCTNDGLTTYKCDCGETRTVPVPKLGHKMKASLPTDATCTTSGYTLYTCENGCDYSYREYNDVAAKGHTWGDWVVDTAATQDAEGLRHRECTVCDGGYEEQTIPAMKHAMEVAESKASTCSEAGYIIYECKTAHEGVDCGYTLRVDIPVAEHSFTTEVTPATCQQNGSVVSSCACGETITTDLGRGIHDLVAVRESEPDCTNDGKVVVKCNLCQHVSYEIAIPATGHNFEAKVTDATCTDEGKIEYTCLADGCGEKSEEIIPAKGHNYVAGEKVDATCTQSAYIPYECSECDSAYNELVSNPVPHSYVKVETVNADCDTDGKEVYKCSCGASYEKAISHFGHSWGAWTITKNPSATEDGEMTRICSRNPNHIETSAIPSLGDSTYTVTFIVDGKEYAKQTIGYGGAATDPGIPVKPYDEEKHYNAYWDVDFSAITSDLTVTAVYNETAHTFGEWTTVRESTCQSKGYRTRACACGYEETRDLELSDHDYTIITEDRMEATCTENGYVVVICSACGKSTKQTVKRLGHSMTYHERVYETCDTDGSLAYYECSVCGKKYADRIGNTELINVVVRKKYHTFVVVEGSAATCTSDGKTDYRHCTTCGLNQPSETIPALGHVDVNNDHICDRCSGTYMEGGQIVCTCNCHKVGFFNELIYKILRFFWKLMGSNKTCACGAIHY